MNIKIQSHDILINLSVIASIKIIVTSLIIHREQQ